MIDSVSAAVRVAIVYPGGTARGVASVCEVLAGSLARKGPFDVSLVALHHSPEQAPPPDAARTHRLNLPVQPQPAADGFHRWLASNPQDLVVVNDSSMLEPYWRHVPAETALVVVLHDDAIRYVRPVLRRLDSIDGIITVSGFIESRMKREAPAFDGLIRTIHNGSTFPPPPARTTSARPERLRCLFVGSDEGPKGAADLPLIFAEMDRLGVSASLTIVGFVSETLAGAFRRRCPGLEITWIKRTPRNRCIELAGEHDIALILSRSEAYGMATVEAMSMGCVPIAYDIESGSREIIQPGESGLLVRLGDFASLALLAQRLLHHPAELRRLSAGACRHARLRFSDEIMAAGYARFIADVLELSRRRRPARLVYTGTVAAPRPSPYQLLPAALRARIRRWVHARPRLSHAVRRWRT